MVKLPERYQVERSRSIEAVLKIHIPLARLMWSVPRDDPDEDCECHHGTFKAVLSSEICPQTIKLLAREYQRLVTLRTEFRRRYSSFVLVCMSCIYALIKIGWELGLLRLN